MNYINKQDGTEVVSVNHWHTCIARNQEFSNVSLDILNKRKIVNLLQN